MKGYHVIMPVDGYLSINERFDAVFTYLNSLDATVHLVSQCQTVPQVLNDHPALAKQQAQIGRMADYLKFESLDKIAQRVQARFTRLSFNLHVTSGAFARGVAKLTDEFDAQFLIIDQPYLTTEKQTKGQSSATPFNDLLAVTPLPIWCVGPNTSTQGDTLVAIDLPALNRQLDQLNRTLIEAGVLFTRNAQSELHLMHSWQLSSEQFMRQWLRLTDIDIARFSRTEKQQRETRIIEYLNEADCQALPVHIQVLEGAADVSLANVCDAIKPQLLIVGYNQNAYGTMGHITKQVMNTVNCDTLVLPQSPEPAPTFRAIHATPVASATTPYAKQQS